jgi:hypothetical protein
MAVIGEKFHLFRASAGKHFLVFLIQFQQSLAMGFCAVEPLRKVSA